MMMARRSPNFSPNAPKIGWPMPQARFWIAIAIEKSARSQPKSSAIGIWKTPKEARIENPTMMIRQPATRTGVIRGARVCSMGGKIRRIVGRVNRLPVMSRITVSNGSALG